MLFQPGPSSRESSFHLPSYFRVWIRVKIRVKVSVKVRV